MAGPAEKELPKEVLAVKNRDADERMSSSSGGVFVALARKVLARKGVVFGAAFDGKWETFGPWVSDSNILYLG